MRGYCPNCKGMHKLEYGTNKLTGEISKTLGFVKCPEDQKLYVSTIGDRCMSMGKPNNVVFMEGLEG
jgi:hypothetical protein